MKKLVSFEWRNSLWVIEGGLRDYLHVDSDGCVSYGFTPNRAKSGSHKDNHWVVSETGKPFGEYVTLVSMESQLENE